MFNLRFILIFLAIFYIIWQAYALFGPPKLVITEPLKDITQTVNSIKLAGKTEEGIDLTINGQKVYTDRNNNFQEDISLKSGLNTIVVKATNRFNKSSEVVRRVVVQ